MVVEPDYQASFRGDHKIKFRHTGNEVLKQAGIGKKF